MTRGIDSFERVRFAGKTPEIASIQDMNGNVMVSGSTVTLYRSTSTGRLWDTIVGCRVVKIFANGRVLIQNALFNTTNTLGGDTKTVAARVLLRTS